MKQTVYIPTKVENEPIPESMGVFTLSRNSSIPSLLRTWNQESKPSVDYEKEKDFTSQMFSHWLKPQEGYFFTEEQLKQLLSDSFDKGRDYQTDFGVINSKEIFIENLLNKEL